MAKLTISANAKVQALGTDTMGEAVNVMGGGNTIINYGLISAVSAPAIWFQDLVVGVPNAIENYGIIESGDRITSNVIGNNGNGAVTFYNHSGASVHGSLNFGGGSDSLLLAPHSTITGNIGGGGGSNTLILYGGRLRRYLDRRHYQLQSIRKDGDGKWTLTGSIGNNNALAARRWRSRCGRARWPDRQQQQLQRVAQGGAGWHAGSPRAKPAAQRDQQRPGAVQPAG